LKIIFSKIVASLTENVKKMDLIEKTKIANDNKENCPVKRTATRKKVIQIPIQCLDDYLAEQIDTEQIEPPYTNENSTSEDDDDEPIDPTYAMDYVADIMNLLYTLEKKYSIQLSFLNHSSSTISTMANGSAIRPWKLTAKHRTIVVGWIIQLFYTRFHLSQDAMHMYEFEISI
jgi:hypothetical protein